MRKVLGSLKEEQYGILCFRNTFKKVDVDGSGEINMQVNLKHHQPKHLKVAKQFILRNSQTETVERLLTVSASTHSSNIWTFYTLASLVGEPRRLSKSVIQNQTLKISTTPVSMQLQCCN